MDNKLKNFVIHSSLFNHDIIMYLKSHLKFLGFALAGMFICQQAQAEIVIATTRIIYKENSKNVDVRIENRGRSPLLLQTWMDTGDKNEDPSKIVVPFTITPPISRLDPKRGQTVTFVYTGSQALPKDRESVFWFNALEVPPKPSDAQRQDASILQMAFRTRIKFFWRPEGIGGDLASASAVEKIKWSAVRENGKAGVQAANNSPFHVSYSSATLTVQGKKYDVKVDMVRPFSQSTFSVEGLNTIPSGSRLDYNAINDYGGLIKGNVVL